MEYEEISLEMIMNDDKRILDIEVPIYSKASDKEVMVLIQMRKISVPEYNSAIGSVRLKRISALREVLDNKKPMIPRQQVDDMLDALMNSDDLDDAKIMSKILEYSVVNCKWDSNKWYCLLSQIPTAQDYLDFISKIWAFQNPIKDVEELKN